MGDLVRSIMEAMVPDIVSLVKRKVFTKKEAKQILKAREAAEYSFLKKNSSQKEFLKAIQFEYDLERQRREKFKELKLKKSKHQDFSILRRIIFIFDRLTAKYKDNIELWKEYCLFCYKIKSNRMFYKAVSNAMAMNWHSLDIWLLAAYYQVEMNNNPFRARKIFLKAIKMNPERKDFWLEYFRFELKFLEIIKKRKELMGVVDEAPKEEGSNIDEEEEDNDEEVIVVEKIDKKIGSDDMMLFEEKKSTSGNDKNEELAVLVFDTITDNFPNDAKLSSEILAICNEFNNNDWIDSIKERIVEIHNAKFNKNPLANLKIMLEIHNIKYSAFENEEAEEFENRFKEFIAAVEENFQEQEQSASDDQEKIKEYKATLIHELQKVLESIYNYLKSIHQNHSETFGNFFELIVNSLLPKDFENSRYFNFFSGICDFMSKTGVANPGLTTFISGFYEQEKKVNKIGEKDSLYHLVLSKVAEVSIKQREIEIVKHDKLVKAIREFLKSLKKSVIPHQANADLLYALADLQAKQITKEEITWILKQALTHLAYTIEFPAFCQKFLSFVINNYGVNDVKTTECMNQLLTLKSACPVEAIFALIDALAKQNPKDPKIKANIKKSLDWNPSEKQLWIRLIKWEKEFGNPMECPEIFQRAQKVIKDVDFLDIYTTIMQE